MRVHKKKSKLFESSEESVSESSEESVNESSEECVNESSEESVNESDTKIDKNKYTINIKNIVNIKIESSKNLPDIIDPEKQLFRFLGKEFLTFFTKNGIMWVQANDIAKFIGYKAPKKAIELHIQKKNKKELIELLKILEKSKINTSKYIQKRSKFINNDGLIELIAKSTLPKAIKLAKFLNLKVHHKFTRKESDIIEQLIDFCTGAKIKYIHQYTINKGKNKYSIDFYLPDYKLAIEIDENNHKHYNQKKENERQKYIKKKLECKFIRFNPDDKNITIGSMFAKIHSNIIKQKYTNSRKK